MSKEDTMAGKDLTKISRDYIEAFNAANWSRVKETLTGNSLYNEVGTQRRIQGADAIVTAFQGWKRAFPDAKGKVTNSVSTGDNVVLEITWEGTHTGPLEGPGGTIAATGRRQVTPAALLILFEGDKIKESRHYFDMMTLLHQIGAVPVGAVK
jgi:steroid delta-isomerase-like uncharacterized protein